jgi:hypothetical protein
MPKQPHSDTIIGSDQNPNSQHQLPDSEHPSVDRRMFLAGAAASTTGLLSMPASAQEVPNADLAAALARFRASIPPNFNRDYVEHVVVPFFLTSFYEGERPALPMIDVNFSKENALPFDLWGLIYEGWKPTPADGVTVFLQGLEKRGDNNLRKRIYFSAVTPDLYRPMYGNKVAAFFDQLMDAQYAGKPFMRHYLDYYFDIYWDLHLGVKGDAVPAKVRQIGEAFNTVLAYRDPMQQIVYENYMTVRTLLDFLKQWIDERVEDINAGRVANPEKTIAWYWLKNAGNGEHFSKKDIVFECFHNFVAFSQWGNTIFGIMSRLTEDGGDPDVRTAFRKTMTSDYDNANGAHYTPLELLVMSCSARSRRTAVASRRSRMPAQQYMVPRRTSASACHSSATATSARRTPAPASIRCIGKTRRNSTRSATSACPPAPRLTRTHPGRSVLPAARSTSRPSR